MRRVPKAVAQDFVAASLVRIPGERPGQERPALGDLVAAVLNMIREPERVERRSGLVQVRKGGVHES
jgi:hypothetical protein